MMTIRVQWIFLFFICVCCATALQAQCDTYMIRFDAPPTKATWTNIIQNGLTPSKKIFNRPIIYVAHALSENQPIDKTKLLLIDGVVDVQCSRQAEERATRPNDEYYPDLWHLAQIDAEFAWDFATNGVTARGDSIVMGILDSGFELDHPDLVNNFWKNRNEIPNDMLDNDNNGYVDDFVGLNLSTGADDHSRKTHGTEVVGVMNAHGNNSIGVTGVSWNSKSMLMSKSVGGLFDHHMIEAFQYAIDFRKQYNETNGVEGAFVVAINLSVGFKQEFAEDYPMLCEAIDELGNHGILLVSATENENYNVDIVGDIPADCPSLYQISVTASDERDFLKSFSAYGLENVDLAAPGRDIMTTKIGRSYGENSGTSLATPQVTGAIALMYMAASDELLQIAKNDPGMGASLIRSLLLANVEKSPDLEDKVASGGRLDLGQAVLAAHDYTASPTDALRISEFYPTLAVETINVLVEVPNDASLLFRVYDMQMGRTVLQFQEEVQSTLGTQRFILPVHTLASGTYVLMVEQGDYSDYAKFVVVR